jgi:signal peptidase I
MSIFSTNPFEQEEKQPEKKNIFIDLLQVVVISLSICVVIYLFIATPNEVHGSSMEPNFFDGEILLTNKFMHLVGNTGLSKIVGDYERGDVVIVDLDNSDEDLIKRIVAVGGDELLIDNGQVYVNDELLEEDYLPEGRTTSGDSFIIEDTSITVPEGSYLVFGDNRDYSLDSRNSAVGFVERRQLKGRVFFRFWPLDRLGKI